jgi:uncharacterized protein (UPF0332 family)
MIKEIVELSMYRLEKASEDLKLAQKSLEIGIYKGAVNRSYYSIFHSLRAVLALNKFDSKKHSGVIAFFQKNYISTGIFDKRHSKIIQNAFEIRNKSDYEDFYIISKGEAQEQVENALEFFETIKNYLATQWII